MKTFLLFKLVSFSCNMFYIVNHLDNDVSCFLVNTIGICSALSICINELCIACVPLLEAKLVYLELQGAKVKLQIPILNLV